MSRPRLIHNDIDWTPFVTGEPLRWAGPNSATDALWSGNKANEIARSEKSPPTYFVGDKRFVDAGVFAEWTRRLGTGEIAVTVEDLRAVRAAGKGKLRGRPARIAAQVGGAA